jgi:hypothetical protein
VTDRDRPIDDYPRIRDAGAFIVKSGLVPAGCGLGFVAMAWMGDNAGYAALMAFLMGAAAMTEFLLYTDGQEVISDA